MIVQLSRSSLWRGKPDPIAYPLDPNQNEGDYFGIYLADIPSIEWAFEKWGDLVIQESNIPGVKLYLEIYDDYRE